MKKKLLKWTKWILLIYGLLGIAIYYFQDYFLFRPESKPINEPYSFSWVNVIIRGGEYL